MDTKTNPEQKMTKIVTMPALVRYTRNADGSDTRRVREFGMGRAHYIKMANAFNARALDSFTVENVKVSVTVVPGKLNEMKLV